MPEVDSAASRPGEIRPAGTPSSGLGTLAIAAIVIAALYFGRDVLVPFALAVLLSFVLAPVVLWLRRRRLGRVPSVLVAVVLAFLLILALGIAITNQVSSLAENLPQYQVTIRDKIRSLRGTGGNVVEQAATVLKDLEQEIADTADSSTPPAPAFPGVTPTQRQEPIPVEITQPQPAPLQVIQDIVGPLIDPLTTSGLVVVFVIFILLQREDLRDRVIRLAGAHDLQRTTQALDEAGYRVSRYLLMQTVVNATYGLPVGIGLWLIGVPNPALWGILAMLLRFIPYIGPFIAAAFPMALSIAVDPGWSMLLWTGALFLGLELVSINLVEPWLYGTSTGLSAVAIIAAATFWTWLWGPIGLLLSTPLTSCLVVLGRHVPQLQFLDVLLGNRPVLKPPESFYQRMLAGDPNEAAEQAEEFLKQKPLSAYYDEVAIPGLALAQYDAERGRLDEERRRRIRETVVELVDDLADHDDLPPQTAKPADPEKAETAPADAAEDPAATPPILKPEDLAPDWRGQPVLCASTRNDLDEAAALLLAQLLEKHGIGARVVECEAVAATNLRRLDTTDVQIVCLSYLDPTGMAHARFLVRRLRRKLPHARILVGFWTMAAEDVARRDPLAGTGADLAATSLREAIETVCAAALEAARTAQPQPVEPLPAAQ